MSQQKEMISLIFLCPWTLALMNWAPVCFRRPGLNQSVEKETGTQQLILTLFAIFSASFLKEIEKKKRKKKEIFFFFALLEAR